MLAALPLLLVAAAAAAVGPPPPAGAVEGDIVDVNGVTYQVHGGLLYTLDDPALDDGNKTVAVTGSHVDKGNKRVVHTDQITAQDIAESGAHTLGDILADQPGIQVNSAFGLGQEVTLDGLDGRQVLVLIDGRPVKGRVDSHVDVSRIPVSASSIERIEIVRGPMSALYGSEAIGGVINIVTKRASQAVGGEVEAGAQFVDGANWSTLGVHGRGGAGPLAARVDVTGSDLPGIDRDHDGKDDLPDRRQLGVHAEAAMPLPSALGDSSFRSALDGSSSQSVARTSGAAPFAERDRTDDWSLSSTYEADLAGLSGRGAALSADLRIDRVHRIFDKLPSGSAPVPPSFCSSVDDNGGLPLLDPTCPAAPVGNTDATEDESRLELKYSDTIVDDVDAAVGALFTREQATRVNGAGDDTLPGGPERDIGSLYAEVLWRPLPWLSLLPGGRVDAFWPPADGGDFALGPKLGARVDLPLGFALRGSYGRGFRLPSFEERLLRFDHSELGYIVLGNPDLKPETSDGFRGELLYEPVDEVSLSAEGYLNLVHDLIDTGASPIGTDDNGTPEFAYRNVGRAYTAGINLKVGVGPYFGFKIAGGYQYLLNAVDASACPDTNPFFCSPAEGAVSLPLRAAHALDATVRYRFDLTGTVLFARVDALSERPIDATTTAPAYAMISIGARQPIYFSTDGADGAELTLTLEDLNDAYDATYGPKPGRSLSALVRVW
ncbi:MAG TPA: TonB-dependent receptor [Myxococcota bacterium]